MTLLVLDDHLLRDLLSDEISGTLRPLLRRNEPATTNLYYAQLCRSVVAARGCELTGSWSAERRRQLGAALTALPDDFTIVPMRALTFRMAELADAYRVSMLGAEAIAAAEYLGAPLCVSGGDDGPGMRAAAEAVGIKYRTISR